MQDIQDLADGYRYRADNVRMIALAITDFQERKRLLEFADDFERLAREVKARYLRVTEPSYVSNDNH